MPGNTIRLHRVLRGTPERVYRAFLDPAAMAKWLPPNGFTGKVHEIDARVGGVHRMSFTNILCTPTTRASISWTFPVKPFHEIDARVGGVHRMSFTNFGTGASHSFGGRYLELKPNERLRYT